MSRYTLDELHAMAERAREAWPTVPGLPLLEEDEPDPKKAPKPERAPRPPVTTCQRKHAPDWLVRPNGKRDCRPCAREKQRARRAIKE